MELYEIDNTIHNIKETNINLFIDGDKLMETIKESKSLIAKLNNLSKDVRKNLYNICNYVKQDNGTIDKKLFELAKNKIKRKMYVLTRAQKRKLEEEKQQQKREERKESKEEEQIWNEMKEEIFKFNDKIAIQSQVYKTLWGARNIDQLTDIQIF